MQDAREWKTRVEHILSANMSGHPLDNTTAEWCHDLPDAAHTKLEAKGLIPNRNTSDHSDDHRLGQFLDNYVTSRIDIKPAPKNVW